MLARILIAEDDPRQAEIVRRYLQAAGYDPAVVGDGRAAIDGLDRNATDRGIDMHVMNLRRKIESDPRRPWYLLTVHGVGYKLTGGPA